MEILQKVKDREVENKQDLIPESSPVDFSLYEEEIDSKTWDNCLAIDLSALEDRISNATKSLGKVKDMFSKVLVKSGDDKKDDERFHRERFKFADVKGYDRCEEKLRND